MLIFFFLEMVYGNRSNTLNVPDHHHIGKSHIFQQKIRHQGCHTTWLQVLINLDQTFSSYNCSSQVLK